MVEQIAKDVKHASEGELDGEELACLLAVAYMVCWKELPTRPRCSMFSGTPRAEGSAQSSQSRPCEKFRNADRNILWRSQRESIAELADSRRLAQKSRFHFVVE